MKTALIILVAVCSMMNILMDPSFAQWNQQQIPNNAGILLSIDFADERNGIAGGWWNFLGRAMYTSNGGTTWDFATVPDSSRSFVTVKMIDSLTGYIAGAYNLHAVQRPAGTLSHLLKKGYSISEINYMESIGMSSEVEYRAMFLKTTDGGRNWFTYGNLPPRYTFLYSADFINSNTGMLTTSTQDTSYPMNATIIKTTDGGMSWTNALDIDSVIELTGIKFIDNNNIIAIGRGGTPPDTNGSAGNLGGMIFRSTDGGSNWDLQFFRHNYFRDVCFANHLTGFITADIEQTSGLYRTTNGGLNWNVVYSQGGDVLIQGVRFHKGTGMIYGNMLRESYNSFTRRTTDYGVTWGPLQVLDTSGVCIMYGGDMISENNQYISGGNPFGQGAIYHTSNGGIVSVTSSGVSIPETSSLMQNYPNPFNPTTKINYKLRVAGYTKLVVYDVLGDEVSTLVNEKQALGTYQVEFDGSGLSSGVYFYKLVVSPSNPLVTEDFTDVKRMMLLK